MAADEGGDEGEGQSAGGDEQGNASLEEREGAEEQAEPVHDAPTAHTVNADHLRRALHEEAEDARLRVLGTRLRPHPPPPPTTRPSGPIRTW